MRTRTLVLPVARYPCTMRSALWPSTMRRSVTRNLRSISCATSFCRPVRDEDLHGARRPLGILERHRTCEESRPFEQPQPIVTREEPVHVPIVLDPYRAVCAAHNARVAAAARR